MNKVSTKSKEVLIIGSGLGGLSTALRLASKGYKVKIVEKHSSPGGRLNSFTEKGFTFDTGPSFMSMTYEFDELFAYCNLDNPLKLKKLDPLYEVRFRGKDKPYKIWSDLDKLANEFKEIEPDFKSKAEKYLKRAGKFYDDTENKIIKSNFKNYFDYFIKMTGVPIKHIPYLRKNLWTLLDETFVSEEVKVIFSLVAFFLGSTPYQTPSIFSILNYTELKHDGYWVVEGGMYKIVTEIVKLLGKFNVEIIYNTEIKNVFQFNGVLNSFKDTEGKEWRADTFIVNADAASFRGQILNRKKYSENRLDKMKWSLAPFTIYLGLSKRVPNLYHHNYFLGDDFRQYADKIFISEILPSRPYYYVNMPSYYDSTCVPPGCENIFILCPVPDLRFKKAWEDKEKFSDEIIKDLSGRINFDIKENILVKKIFSPVEWESMFNLYRGSGLGLSHNIMQVAGLRPSNKDEKFPNLFYVGASTIPGTGLPMVLISSKLVTERVLNEL